MCVVPVKSVEKQGAAAVLRVRELLIRHRRQTIGALQASSMVCTISIIGSPSSTQRSPVALAKTGRRYV